MLRALLATLLLSLLLWADALHDDGDEIPDGFGLDDFAPEGLRGGGEGSHSASNTANGER